MSTQEEATIAIANDSLPPGWRMSTIGELLKVRNGFAFKSTDYQEDGALLIRQSNLDGSRVSVEKAKYLPLSYLEQYRDFQIKKGDILIGMSGSIGKLCSYDRDEPALQNQRTGLLVFKDAEQKPWVWHYLPLLEKELVKVGKGIAVQNVSASQIESFPIPVAPLDQQKRIVAEIEKQFSRLDEAVANLKRVKVNLKRYKAAVLKAAVEGRLVETEAERARLEGRSYETGEQLLQRILATRRSQWQGKGKYKEPAAPDTSDLPELPEGWVWASSEVIFDFVTSGSRGWAKYYSDSGSIFLRVGNLDHGTIGLDLSEIQHVVPPANPEADRSRVKLGDLLISITAELGMVAVIPENLGDAYINQHVAIARSTVLVDKNYIGWYFACEQAGKKQLESLRRGATKAGLGLDDIRSVCIALPPLSEQHRIVAEVDRRFSLLRQSEAQLDANLQRAERLRQSVLSDAFSGNSQPLFLQWSQ